MMIGSIVTRIAAGVGLLTLVACASSPPQTAQDAPDMEGLRAVNAAWFAANNAGDADALAALYADDAVVGAPGAAPASGRAAIREHMARDIAEMGKGGFKLTAGSSPQFGASGNLGWEWNTFTVTDKSGKTVDTGKYLTLSEHRDGKWVIIRDIWNSDTPPAPPPAETAKK
jgi:uncharacterized protein (TIGR02246 family)